MKDNFLLKVSQKVVFNELTNEDAGKLIKGIFEYVDTKQITLDGYLKVIFLPIKEDIDKNEEKYKLTCEKNKNNGKLGGRPKSQKNPKKPNGFSENPKKPINHNHIHIHIINYLNNKLNSKYKYNSKITIEKINARLNEGYTYEDFIKVIDTKYNEWKGTEFEKYLCPETLFGTKFEKYLNQKEKSIDKKEPIWLNKEQQVDLASDEEQEAMKRMLESYGR